jgi:transposase
VELFEEIRREYEFGIGTIKGVAEKFGVHRRMVRQAIKDALPPVRKEPVRERPQIGRVSAFIDEILISDRRLPRKQRHTALRIYQRIRKELEIKIGRSTVCRYIQRRKAEMGLVKAEIFVPQNYRPGIEVQIDWYEAIVEMSGQQQKVQVYSMRSMFSGAAFHCAYLRATQQAFFEAHQLAFQYFGGVFQLCRYDNLKAAVKKVARGYTREESTRFIAFRSHWQFEGQVRRAKRARMRKAA